MSFTKAGVKTNFSWDVFPCPRKGQCGFSQTSEDQQRPVKTWGGEDRMYGIEWADDPCSLQDDGLSHPRPQL